MVYRTRSSSKSADDSSERTEVGLPMKVGSSLHPAVSLPSHTDPAEEEVPAHSGDVHTRDEPATNNPEKPNNVDSSSATPKRSVGMEVMSGTESSTDGSMSYLKKTRTSSRKRECSASVRNSPARITRSMRRAGIITPKDSVELDIVLETSSEAIVAKESNKQELVADDDFSSSVKGDTEAKFSTLKKFSSSQDFLVSSNVPVNLATEEELSIDGSKQLAMKCASSYSKGKVEGDNTSGILSTPLSNSGRKWDSTLSHEQTISKHGRVEATVDSSVPTSKSLRSDSIEALSLNTSINSLSNVMSSENPEVLDEKAGDVQVFSSTLKGSDASISNELLLPPTFESLGKSTPVSICRDDAEFVQKSTQLPDVDEIFEASGEGGQIYSQIETFKQMFKRPEFYRKDCDGALTALYGFAFGLEARKNDLPSKFVNNDVETVWQFISYRGKQIIKEFRKGVSFLENSLLLQDSAASSSEEDSDGDRKNCLNNENEDSANLRENGMDLLHRKGENMEVLKRSLEESHDENDEFDENNKPFKKYPKSPVDDEFFSLAEMNAFLDEQDRTELDSATILDTVDDSCIDATNYFYEDFFGEKGDVVKDKHIERKRRRNMATKETGVEQEESKKFKTVRFAMDIRQAEQSTIDEAVTSKGNELSNDHVLLENRSASEKPESILKTSLKRLKQTIAKLEEDNLATRPWELSGEVTAQQRSENELLEKDLQFDHGTKKPPEITELFTEKLEELIRQRIKDKAFDDVIRKKRIEERTEPYRNQAIEDQEMLKVSLAEVYEKEYQRAVGELKNSNTVNEQHAVIEKQMRELFRLIDALSNFDYTPPEVQPEIRVVSNMPALKVEEVGMTASTDEQLLAPEEMKKPQKGDLKSTDELDRTDKLRRRRKKKNRQRAMIEVFGENLVQNQREMKKKRTRGDDVVVGTEKLKSSNFFTKLQETVRNEVEEKAVKKRKVKSEQVSQSSSKYKL